MKMVGLGSGTIMTMVLIITLMYMSVGCGEDLRRKALITDTEPRVVRFLPDDVNVAVGDAKGLIQLWDVNEGKPSRAWQAHEGAVRSLVLSSDGHYLASEGSERKAKVWRSETTNKVFECNDPSGSKQLAEPDWANGRIAFSADNNHLAAFGFFWEVESEAQKNRYGPRGAVAMSKRWLATGSRRGFQVVEADSLTKQFEVKDDSICNFAISPDQTMLAVGRSTYDAGLRLYKLPSGEEICKFPELQAWIFCVTFSPDSTQLAVSSRRQGVWIFDTKTFSVIKKLSTEEADNYGLDYSSDGKLLAGAGIDRRIRIWNLPSFDRRY